MTVVQADGTNVQPVAVEEFRIGVAETFDVLVSPTADAHTIFAQAQDRSGFARATLATRAGATAAVPPMDPRPLRTMADMGMGGMEGMDMSGMDMSKGQSMPQMNMDSVGQAAKAHAMPGMTMNPEQPAMPEMNMSGNAGMPRMNMDSAGHGAMALDMPGMKMGPNPSAMPEMNMGQASQGASKPDMQGMDMEMSGNASVPSANADGVDLMTLDGKPSVDNVAMQTSDRQNEAGTGLNGNGRQVLTYSQLTALTLNDEGPPTRELQFHLTGNMERWTWGFDGKRFSEAEPIRIKLGERMRFLLINDTMMEHPIHLHGFLFQVENGQNAMPYKHTINVKPGERVGVLFTADTSGYWAFHCHLLYHMEMGMFRTVVVA
jgi:FtsP/CotA-like multicopper oxidase with cupredoxin domain